MLRVALDFSDPGLEFQLSNTLEQTNVQLIERGDRSQTPDCILLTEQNELASKIATLRSQRPIPGIVILANSPQVKQFALQHRVQVLDPAAVEQHLGRVIRTAYTLRHTFELTMHCAADALGPAVEATQRSILLHYPNATEELTNEIAQTFATYYVSIDTATTLGARDQELIKGTNGAKTLASHIRSAPDQLSYVKLVWALASCQLGTFSPKPLNRLTPIRTATSICLLHLQRRVQRLQNATHYDVLEIPPTAENNHIMTAANTLAHRFHPDFLNRFDLGASTPYVDSLWKQILQARVTLLEPVNRANYNDWITQNRSKIKSDWLDLPTQGQAREAYQQGQQALKNNQTAKAMNQFSLAARQHKHVACYEAYLSLTRFRMKVAEDKLNQQSIALGEVNELEERIAGLRPDPAALVPLAMLYYYAGDKQSALWYTEEALRLQPKLAAAQQLRAKLQT